MEKVNEYKLELACGIALSAVAVTFYHEYSVAQSQYRRQQAIQGLTNYSSSCYMNALLQMLATMPEYVEKLSMTKNELGATLHAIMTRINEPTAMGAHFDGSSMLVSALRSQAKMRVDKTKWNFSNEQQDCSEFCQMLNHSLEAEFLSPEEEAPLTLNNVNRECKRERQTRWTSVWPHRLLTLRKMTCVICKHEKEDRLERHDTLSLIPQRRRRLQRKTDLELSMDSYFGSESIGVDCEACKRQYQSVVMTDSIGSSPMSRTSTPSQLPMHDSQTFLASMPAFICCQVNNSMWDALSSTSFKNQQMWTYPERIDMSKYAYHIKGPQWYTIEAVISHIGGTHCGHYFTWRKVKNRWYECNDQRIHLLGDSSGTGARSPYMLLYKKDNLNFTHHAS